MWYLFSKSASETSGVATTSSAAPAGAGAGDVCSDSDYDSDSDLSCLSSGSDNMPIDSDSS